jgi:hypothetical protein
MLCRTGKAWDPVRTAATSKAKDEPMSRKAEDRTRGLAERSLNTSIVPPTEGNSGHRIRNDRFASDRRLENNDQREGMDKTERNAPNTQDSNGF